MGSIPVSKKNTVEKIATRVSRKKLNKKFKKMAERMAEKMAEKMTEKMVGKVVGKMVGKVVGKTVGKTVGKVIEIMLKKMFENTLILIARVNALLAKGSKTMLPYQPQSRVAACTAPFNSNHRRFTSRLLLISLTVKRLGM